MPADRRVYMSFPMASDTKTKGETADSDTKPATPNAKDVAAEVRRRRQAQALRDNLKRRKEQARGRRVDDPAGEER